MRFRFAFVAAAILAALTLSGFAWNSILLKPHRTITPSVPYRLEHAPSIEFLIGCPSGLKTWGEGAYEPIPLYAEDYWVQVNEDGFGGTSTQRQKRAQAMFLAPFNIDGKTWFYCGIEGVNHAEIWRTDGTVSGTPPVLEWTNATDYSAFAYPNKAADCAICWNNDFYIGTRNEQGTAILRYYKRQDGSWEWVQVNEPGFGKTYTDANNDTYYTDTHTRAMAVFTSADDETECLYVGTYNWYSGCEVWRTDGSLKDGGPQMNWEQVNYGGFGASGDNADNLCVMDMIVFDANDGEGPRLYAGTYNWYDSDDPDYDDERDWDAGRIFRYAEDPSDTKRWDEVWDGVVGGSGTGADPYRYALSARSFAEFDNKLWVGLFHLSGDDFYSSVDGSSWSKSGSLQAGVENDVVDMMVYGNCLWASGRNGSKEGNNDHQYVWRTTNGSDWEKRSRDGFGDYRNRSIYCFGVFKGDLYAGTWNTETDFGAEDGTGCEVWKTTEDATYITLDSFEATALDDGSILLRWKTGTEIGTAGFHLYRSVSADFDSFKRVTTKLIDATGTPEAGGEYAVLDRSVNFGVFYYYFLVEVDVNGKMSAFGPVQARAKIPQPVSFEMYSAIIQLDTLGV